MLGRVGSGKLIRCRVFGVLGRRTLVQLEVGSLVTFLLVFVALTAISPEPEGKEDQGTWLVRFHSGSLEGLELLVQFH